MLDIYIKPDLFGIFYPFWEIGFNLFKDLQICGGAKSLQKLYVNIVSLPKKVNIFYVLVSIRLILIFHGVTYSKA